MSYTVSSLLPHAILLALQHLADELRAAVLLDPLEEVRSHTQGDPRGTVGAGADRVLPGPSRPPLLRGRAHQLRTPCRQFDEDHPPAAGGEGSATRPFRRGLPLPHLLPLPPTRRARGRGRGTGRTRRHQAVPSRRPAAQPRLYCRRGMIVDEVLLAGVADEALQPKGLPLPVARELERPVVQPQVAPSTDRTRFPFTERTPAS